MSLNLYTYCANNPIRYVDPNGHSYATLPDGTKYSINSNSDAQKFREERSRQVLELQKPLFDVYLGVHKVLGNTYHTSVVIFANRDFEKEYTAQYKRYFVNEYEDLFKNTDDRGLKYVTLGAGTDGKFEFFPKNLVSKPNRKKDVMLDNKVQMINLNVSSPYTVYKLIACQQHYQKTFNTPSFPSNSVNYGFFPETFSLGNEYNSNSFTHGLLNAVGIDTPMLLYNVPGWDTPLPTNYFGNFNDTYYGWHQDKVDEMNELWRR